MCANCGGCRFSFFIAQGGRISLSLYAHTHTHTRVLLTWFVCVCVCAPVGCPGNPRPSSPVPSLCFFFNRNIKSPSWARIPKNNIISVVTIRLPCPPPPPPPQNHKHPGCATFLGYYYIYKDKQPSGWKGGGKRDIVPPSSLFTFCCMLLLLLFV